MVTLAGNRDHSVSLDRLCFYSKYVVYQCWSVWRLINLVFALYVKNLELSDRREGGARTRREQEVKEEIHHRLRFDSFEWSINHRTHWFFSKAFRFGCWWLRSSSVNTRSTGGTLIPRKWKAREWLMTRPLTRKAGNCGSTSPLFPVFSRKQTTHVTAISISVFFCDFLRLRYDLRNGSSMIGNFEKL